MAQNILRGFASLRENQSSLFDKTKLRSKRSDILKNAIAIDNRLRQACGFVLPEPSGKLKYYFLCDLCVSVVVII
jgi:molybdopterin-biosynthesis enzyme MoeA-like protein